DNDAQFFVGNNHQMLYEDDVSPENKNPSAEQKDSSLQEEIARQNGDSAGQFRRKKLPARTEIPPVLFLCRLWKNLIRFPVRKQNQ
ncbi:MAG: hypothetical protein MR305_09960, partial [Treponema porcinum]|nr:hypothetical protein [Treponema porcinum]